MDYLAYIFSDYPLNDGMLRDYLREQSHEMLVSLLMGCSGTLREQNTRLAKLEKVAEAAREERDMCPECSQGWKIFRGPGGHYWHLHPDASDEFGVSVGCKRPKIREALADLGKE